LTCGQYLHQQPLCHAVVKSHTCDNCISMFVELQYTYRHDCDSVYFAAGELTSVMRYDHTQVCRHGSVIFTVTMSSSRHLPT